MYRKTALLSMLLCTVLFGAGCSSAEEGSGIQGNTDSVLSDTVTEASSESGTVSKDNTSEETSEAPTDTSAEETTVSEEKFDMSSPEMKELSKEILDNNGYLGVVFLGCEGEYSGNTAEDLFEQAANDLEGMGFEKYLDSLSYIECEGEEVYLLIPASEDCSITVYERLWGEFTEDGMPERGKLLYEGGAGELIIVKGNISDIVSNIEASVMVGSEERIYNPSLSLNDGRVSREDGVVDLTYYDAPSLYEEFLSGESSWSRIYDELLYDFSAAGANGEEGYSFIVEFNLYDIDKDGIPELFVKTGTCEADYQTSVYYVDGTEAVPAGSIGSGHSVFCSYPGENGFLKHTGHMGYAYIQMIRLENGCLVSDDAPLFEEDINGDPDAEYTSVNEIVNDSVMIPYYEYYMN
ncbi:MAG: hypothetical protein ACI4KF_05150 [Huintestinicola sp.]